MKPTAYLCGYLLLKQLVSVYVGNPGTFSVLLSVVYAASLIVILALPFKLEVKIVDAVALLMDAAAPSIGGVGTRLVLGGILVFWLITYFARLMRGSVAVQNPWREACVKQ